jgi:hypothetical protein
MSPKKMILMVFLPVVLLLTGCNPSSTITIGCSVSELIQAINGANANPNETTIVLEPACWYVLTEEDNDVGFGMYSPGESGANGLPAITSPIILTSDHDDPASIVRSSVAGTPEFRFFFVASSGHLTLQNIILENGLNRMAGGAIAIDRGRLTLDYAQLFRNASPGDAPYANTTGGGAGGAIENYQGTVEIHNSSISWNQAKVGGGIDNSLGGVISADEYTLINNNSADAHGGAVNNMGEFSLSVGHISFNHSGLTGGGITNQGAVSLAQVLFQENTTGGEGGGIFSYGIQNFSEPVLTLTDCTFHGNQADNGGGIYNVNAHIDIQTGSFVSNTAVHDGGGIANIIPATVDWPDVEIHETIFQDNQAGLGGGIHNMTTMVVENSTFSGNRATDGYGGGIDNVGNGQLRLVGSTVMENTANAGAGISNNGNLQMLNCTVSGNTGTMGAGIANTFHAEIFSSTIADNIVNSAGFGALYSPTGRVDIFNSIVARNSPFNCSQEVDEIVPGEENLTDDDTCPGFTIVANPMLGPLADNGGLTKTHALLAGSPAIDSSGDCFSWFMTCSTDQRGEPRPFPAGGTSDLGAYEAGILLPPIPPELADDTPGARPQMNLNCRSGTSTVFPPVTILTPNQVVPILAVNPSGTWIRVRPSNGKPDCWVWVEGVEVTGGLSSVPVEADTPIPAPEDTGPQAAGCWVVPPVGGDPVCTYPCPPDPDPGGACEP